MDKLNKKELFIIEKKENKFKNYKKIGLLIMSSAVAAGFSQVQINEVNASSSDEVPLALKIARESGYHEELNTENLPGIAATTIISYGTLKLLDRPRSNNKKN